jgi:hypothetical protein
MKDLLGDRRKVGRRRRNDITLRLCLAADGIKFIVNVIAGGMMGRGLYQTSSALYRY